jgi:hypothetical protein
MRTTALLILLTVAVAGCSTNRGRTTQMFPDCTQATAEEQAQGKCMHRPDIPDGV